MHQTGLFAMGRKIVDYCFRPLDQAGLPSYNTAGPVTFLASDLLQRLILRDCNGAARNDTTPTAQQIVDALTVMGRPPVAGHTFEFVIRNSSGGAFASTILAGAGVTLSRARPPRHAGQRAGVHGGRQQPRRDADGHDLLARRVEPS